MRQLHYGDFTGLNTDDSKFALSPQAAVDASNVIIDEGSIKPRPFLDQVGLSSNLITSIYPLYTESANTPILVFPDANCAAVVTNSGNWSRLETGVGKGNSAGQFNTSNGISNIFGTVPTLNGSPTFNDEVSANSIVNAAFDGVDDSIEFSGTSITAADNFVVDIIIDNSVTSGPVMCGVCTSDDFFNVSVDTSNLPTSIDVTFSGEKGGTAFNNTVNITSTGILDPYLNSDFPHLSLRVDCDASDFRLIVNGIIFSTESLGSFDTLFPFAFYAGRNYDGSTYTYGEYKYDYFAIAENESLVTNLPDHNTPRAFINGQFLDTSGSISIPLKNNIDINSPNDSYVTIDSQVYIATNVAPAKVVYLTGGGFDIVAVPFGLPKPPTPVRSGGSGSGTNYTYRITFVDKFGNESPISDESSAHGDTSINFNAITVPTAYEDVITGIRIYSSSANQAFHYFVDEDTNIVSGDITPTGVDPTAQALTVQAPELADFVPSRFSHVELYRDRLYAGDVTVGSNRFVNRVYFSDVLNKELFNEFNYFVVGGSDEPITGLVSYRDALIIFKPNEIYFAANDPLSNSFVVRKISPNIGCTAPRTIKVLDNYLLWLSTSGVYMMTDISNPIRVSGSISGELELPKDPTEYLEKAQAEVDTDRKYYILSVGYEGLNNTKTLVLHIDEFLKFGRPVWTKWDFGFTGSCLLGVTNETNRTLLAKTNVIYAFDTQPTPAEANITWAWETGFFNGLNQGSYQRLQYATMMVQFGSDGDNFNFEYKVNLDNVAFTGTAFTSDQNQANYKIHLGTRSEYVQFKMSGVCTDTFKVFGYMLQGSRSGRR